MTKKTLVARFHIDVTYAPDAVIDAYKTLISHSAKANEMVEKVDFEILVENQEDTVASMLKAVQSEFTALTANLAETEASEKSDGLGSFLRLIMAADEEHELTIVGEPYVVDKDYDLTLIPVDNGFDVDTQFALCDYKEYLAPLDCESIQKIKGFDMIPYKQGSDDEQH